LNPPRLIFVLFAQICCRGCLPRLGDVPSVGGAPSTERF